MYQIPPPSTPPNPLNAGTLQTAGYELAGQPIHMDPPPIPLWIDSNGGQLLQSELAFQNQANAHLTAINDPGPSWSLAWFLAPEDLIDPTGTVPAIPKGSLFVRIKQDAPSLYVPPTPIPVQPLAFFGGFLGAITWTQGQPPLLSWTAFNGTNYDSGDNFIAGPGMLNTKIENPEFNAPSLGVYQVRMWYGIKCIVRTGDIPATPSTS